MKDILFVSAQPDVPYFHWQSKLYIHNFIKNGVDPKQIHVIFGISDQTNEPSDGGLDIVKTGVNVHFIKDQRDKKNYIPSIKPYLIQKWLEQDETRGKLFFLHDSDIILTKKLDIEELLQDDKIYMSDTKNYIGYDYLKNCSKKYEKNFTNCYEEQLIDEMIDVVGIDKEIIKQNKENSGGAQYIIKNTNSILWDKIYKNSTELYEKMMRFQRRYPLKDGKVQFWTAEMWSILWNLWIDNKQTQITDQLDFAWATDKVQKFFEKPILHMAGITEEMKHTRFYKGSFINNDPIELLKKDETYFNYIDPRNITTKYVDNIKSYLQKSKN
jgi:hypothetical protein